MQQIRVGVIGAGRMGRNHCRVFSTLRHATLVGVCDQNRNVGREVADSYEVSFFSEIDDLFQQVDAVSLAVPTPAHFELAMRCLERGIHVLIEKPITETLQQAELLTVAAEKSGLVVQVGHIERFNPTYIELKNVLEDVTLVAIDFRRLSPYVGSNMDVDVVLDLMIHDLDLVLDLVGQEPISVTASGLVALSGGIDHAVANLKFATGPLLTVSASRLTEQKVRLIEVTALEAYLLADLLNKSISIHRSMVGEYLNQSQRGVKYRQESIVERIHVPIAEPLHMELQHFVDCVRNLVAPMVTARHGLRALQLAGQIREAVHENLLDISQARSMKPGLPSFAPSPQVAEIRSA